MIPSDVETNYLELVAKYREYSTLNAVVGLLQWDQQTYMPPKGGAARAEETALLSGIAHEKITDPKVGDLIGKLEAATGELAEPQRVNLREIARDYRKATRVPKELVEELNRHQSISHEVWVKARESGRFADFAPSLEKMVELMARQAEHLGYKDTPLDALIDQFEPDATAAMFTVLFDELKAATVPLVQKVLASNVKADRAFLTRDYPAHLQKQFGERIMRQLGFDMDSGRLDTAVHPFCAGLLGDVRITTRYNVNAPQQSLFGVIHETGHGLYEQGLPAEHSGTPLSEALSYGIHESQSRLWENFIGRGRPFWVHFLPILKDTYPEPLRDVSLDQFLLAVNHVQRSLVRVEADELTYDLHIIIRFEIERDLFAGKIKVADLPQVWNEKIQTYLGVIPPNDGKEGVLQDVHWPAGLFGYFPSYSLGNIAAAQLWHALRRDLPNADAKVEAGDFSGILGWLREKVHVHGRGVSRDELLIRATGKPLQTADYARYLTDKYSALYHL
ncbi:carboxypeptidase M32 [bacterium]|nr:carboxypeptidase M32 [bacterium]MBU1984161.1 carboxypeptidase M32 [bacterium]